MWHDRFEQHVEHLAHTIQDGKLSSKAQELLEYVQKETIDIIIQETGIVLEEDETPIKDEPEEETGEYIEEISFERCYYIYGGPEYLEVCSVYYTADVVICRISIIHPPLFIQVGHFEPLVKVK